MIEELDLSYNNLVSFPKSCIVEFDHIKHAPIIHSLFPKLKILKLNFNRLQFLRIDSGVDSCLPNLTNLQLIGNYIEDFQAGDFFKGFPKLMYLKLENQRRIHDDSVAYNLQLPGGPLKSHAFNQTVLLTPRLRVLYMNGNSLTLNEM